MTFLFLAGLCRDVELQAVAVSEKQGDGYDLVITGRARRAADGAVVRLRFRRVANRLDASGVIVTEPRDSAGVRKVRVVKEAFVHRESFRAPGDVEVEIRIDPADQVVAGMVADRFVRIFRIAPGSEVVWAARREMRRFEAAVTEARKPGRARHALIRRLREEDPDALLTATFGHLASVLSDGDSSLDRVRSLCLREVALLLVREVAGDDRTINALRKTVDDLRQGPHGREFVELTTIEGVTLYDLLERRHADALFSRLESRIRSPR